jgi:hypothetical protein
MNDYQSLYSWAMERQMELREQAERRRIARQLRRRPAADSASVDAVRLQVLSGTAEAEPARKSA